MDFNRPWTEFAVEAEYEHVGASRIVAAHNALRTKCERMVPLPDLDALIECMRPIITSNHWDGGQLADAIIAWLKDQPAPNEPSHE